LTSFFLHVAFNDICCDVARDSHWILPPKQRLPYLFMVIGADGSGAPSHSPNTEWKNRHTLGRPTVPHRQFFRAFCGQGRIGTPHQIGHRHGGADLRTGV